MVLNRHFKGGFGAAPRITPSGSSWLGLLVAGASTEAKGAWEGSGDCSIIFLIHGPVIEVKLPLQEETSDEILPGVEHRQSYYLNNRRENSPQPTRQRERRMQGFTSAGHAQRFLSEYGSICQHFRPRRHLLSAYRQEMKDRFES
jgi:hypothetical protein